MVAIAAIIIIGSIISIRRQERGDVIVMFRVVHATAIVCGAAARILLPSPMIAVCGCSFSSRPRHTWMQLGLHIKTRLVPVSRYEVMQLNFNGGTWINLLFVAVRLVS